MAAITAALVKELRDMTGAGMMDAKKALVETDGNVDEAVDWLRKKGLSKAAKKSGRVAAEGLVAVATSGTAGAVVEVNAETDFVARNEIFQGYVGKVAQAAVEAKGDLEVVKGVDCPGTSRNFADEITHLIATIGENMGLRRAAYLAVEQGVVASYVHGSIVPGMGKIGVLVALESAADAAALDGIAKQIAMHIAATNPASLSTDDLDPAIVERERKVLVDQAVASGKPQEIAEKMVEGRMRKYYEEVVLLEQTFVINTDFKVGKFIEAQGKELGSDIKMTGFMRFELGDGIEKEESDFAAEVKAAAGV